MNKFYKVREPVRTTWKDYATSVLLGLIFAILFYLFV